MYFLYIYVYSYVFTCIYNIRLLAFWMVNSVIGLVYDELY